jgi:DivIVA domain-containing protein
VTEPRILTGVDVRAVEFNVQWWRSGAYDREKIDQLIESIAGLMEEGFSPVDFIASRAPRRMGLGRGYDAAQVDRFLEQLILQYSKGAPLAAEVDGIRQLVDGAEVEASGQPGHCGGPWEVGVSAAIRAAWYDQSTDSQTSFDALRGTRLIYRHKSVLTLDGDVLAQVLAKVTSRLRTYLGLGVSERFAVGQVTYGLRSLDRRHRGGVTPDLPEPAVEALARRTGRNLDPSSGRVGNQDPTEYHPYELEQLTDEASGQSVLWASGKNYAREATKRIVFPDGRLLRFPVYGRNSDSAVMAAVDESGVRHVLYKRTSGQVSLVVNPADGVSWELLLVVLLSAPLLGEFFKTPGTGAGGVAASMSGG